jgi:hypothetical protein
LIGADRGLASVLPRQAVKEDSDAFLKGELLLPKSCLSHSIPTFSYRCTIDKSRQVVKSDSDNIAFFVLYGTAIHACQGADCLAWYREEGLSEQIILPDNTRAFGDGSSA